MLSAASSRRTSASVDDDEAEIVQRKPKTSLRLKKGVVLSDDEDEIPEVVSKKAARKLEAFNKAILLEEKEAKEMMEIDDGQSWCFCFNSMPFLY